MFLCVQALEERQRQLRATDGAPPPRLTSQHLYNTVNAQMGIIQAQVTGRTGGVLYHVPCTMYVAAPFGCLAQNMRRWASSRRR